MFQKQTEFRRWCKFLCLFVLSVLLFGNSMETALMQDLVPLATPRAQQVVGGEDAELGEFPWQGWFIFRTPTGTYSCGASLIHPKWVLTAAHCARNATINEVLLGAHTMSDSTDPGRQELPVQEIYVHPNFNGWNNDNDIALIELATAATENERVHSISIVNDTTDAPLYAPNVLSIVTGWGALSEGGFAADTLQKVELPIVDQAVCNQAYDGSITENMLCAGYPEGGKDSCQGDSGGPLIVPDGMAGWKQAGIVSWGVGCARPDYYGVYTKLANYADWIIMTTNGEVGSEPTPFPTPSGTLTGTITVTALPSATIPPVTATVAATAPPTEPTSFPPLTDTPTPSATTTPVDPFPSFTPSATATVTPNPSAMPAPMAAIVNGNFNAGPDGAWFEALRNQQGPGVLIRTGESIPATDPIEGYAAWLGGQNSSRTILAQTITVPDAMPIALIFDYETQSGGDCGHDTAVVRMVDPDTEDSGAVVLATYDLCAATNTGGWQTALLDLAPLAGQTHTLQFIVETDSETLSHFFLDNVAFTSHLVDGLTSGPSDGLSSMALAAQSGAQNIALDWEAPRLAQVSSYRVLRWNGQGAFVVLGQVTETYLVDSYEPDENPLVRGEEYCYSVEALDAAGKKLGESNRACAIHGQLALSIPELVGRPGQTLAVPVAIHNAEGIEIIDTDLWLDFDPRVLAVRDVAAAPLSAQQLEWTYSETNLSEAVQQLRVGALVRNTALARGAPELALHGGGTLFWLFFDVIGEAGTTSPLTLQPMDGSGAGSSLQVQDSTEDSTKDPIEGGWTVPLVLQSGSVEIVAQTQSRATMGDITGEGRIDDTDVRSVLQFTTERTGLTVPQRRASDVTGDNKINAADAALIYYHTLAGEWTLSTPQRSPDASAQVSTTVTLNGARSDRGATITTTLQITNADNMAGADLLIAYDSTLLVDVLEITLGGALQNGTVSWHRDERGFLNIALATTAPIDGNALLVHIVWRLADNVSAANGPAPNVHFSLLDMHLSDAVGRDFVTGFANHTLRGESTPISLAVDEMIFLPTIIQPGAP